MSLILASSSPRRAELLKRAGLEFRIVVPAVEEGNENSVSPRGIALRLARKKAAAVVGAINSGPIIAADTLVVSEGEVMGKPSGRDEAGQMLRQLSGNRHEVLTALVLHDPLSGWERSGVQTTKVWFKELSEKQIEAYIRSEEPFDKAGAYGIQDRAALFIEKIDGCYTNVVGLPMGMLFDFLSEMKVSTWLSGKDGDHE